MSVDTMGSLGHCHRVESSPPMKRIGHRSPEISPSGRIKPNDSSVSGFEESQRRGRETMLKPAEGKKLLSIGRITSPCSE